MGMMKNLKSMRILLLLIAASRVAIAASWITYTNKTYHFKINYPTVLSTSKQFSSAYFFRTAWTVNNSEANTLLQHALFEIQLPALRGSDKTGGAYYYNAFVRTGVSTALADIKNCETATRNFLGSQSISSAMIGGKKFSVFSVSDVGMSQFMAGNVYRYLRQGKCYSLEYLEAGSNRTDIPRFTAARADSKSLALKIISTFRFT
jgi:hypothetical protein